MVAIPSSDAVIETVPSALSVGEIIESSLEKTDLLCVSGSSSSMLKDSVSLCPGSRRMLVDGFTDNKMGTALHKEGPAGNIGFSSTGGLMGSIGVIGAMGCTGIVGVIGPGAIIGKSELMLELRTLTHTVEESDKPSASVAESHRGEGVRNSV